ncbi:hypothetical protein [Microbulbifer taiwanensis]|uniref:Uncharacterized protein n=1 Tax=Microbulbifer taiwanensis TaxID=986746 RepID=A0ABW1YLE2_9GAMM|nr:hypothetical protein [Microbulbifer taiwanensis]
MKTTDHFTPLYRQIDHALTLDQIDYALNQISDRKATLIESSGGPEKWRAGYAIKIDGAWYWFPRGYALQYKMPGFVRSEEDALEFIQAAEPWYAAGVNNGVEYAQHRLRNWVDQKMLSEL